MAIYAASSGITFYGADWCGDCRRSKRQLEDLGVAFDYRDVAADDAHKDAAIALSGTQSIPVIAFTDGTMLIEPSNPQLEAKLRALGII